MSTELINKNEEWEIKNREWIFTSKLLKEHFPKIQNKYQWELIYFGRKAIKEGKEQTISLIKNISSYREDLKEENFNNLDERFINEAWERQINNIPQLPKKYRLEQLKAFFRQVNRYGRAYLLQSI